MKNYPFLRSIAVYMLVSTISVTLKAQSGFTQDGEKQRPSADSWEMVRYGKTGASLYTGTISLRIPFYEYRDNDFTLPIQISYSSNGCQPNIRALCAGNNAEVELFEYIPLVGMSRYTDATGRVFTYEYNNSGKLKRVTDSEGKSVEEAYYSPDNRLSGIRQADVQPETF